MVSKRELLLLVVPETFSLDAEGRAVAHTLGQRSERELAAGIAGIARGTP